MSHMKKELGGQLSLLSVQEVATVLGVCRQTVYAYIYREGLPYNFSSWHSSYTSKIIE